mmetsp:Transcript_65048/g.89408  ORF Transcript_65048/g.89408 Transcript_65048/m.89408 type:complete len:83 (-) Transcript_65048:861-1109(-)
MGRRPLSKRFVTARKQWCPHVKLGQDATNAPHIDFKIVRDAEKYLRSTVPPALNVFMQLAIGHTRAAKINKLHAALPPGLEE